jgi:hypothetical protein
MAADCKSVGLRPTLVRIQDCGPKFICGIGIVVIISVFQTDERGSIPLSRSNLDCDSFASF